MKDYYYILGVSKNATADEIKKAYRKLCLKFHPDKTEGDAFYEHRFKEIVEAYKTLGTEENRKMYDRLMRQHESKFHTASQFATSTGTNHFYKPYTTPGAANIKREDRAQRRIRSRERLKGNLGRYLFTLVGLSLVAVIIANYKLPESNLAFADLHPGRVDTSRPAHAYPENVVINTLNTPPLSAPIGIYKAHRQFHHSTAMLKKVVANRQIKSPAGKTLADTLYTTKLETETSLLNKLRMYTPDEIYIGPPLNTVSTGAEKEYYEKGYTYTFSSDNLVVEYIAYHLENAPVRFREVIPVKDINRVYVYDGSLWIGTNAKSIIEYNLTNNTQFASSFFSVKYDSGKEQNIEQMLYARFIHLKALATRNATNINTPIVPGAATATAQL